MILIRKTFVRNDLRKRESCGKRSAKNRKIPLSLVAPRFVLCTQEALEFLAAQKIIPRNAV